MDKPKAPSSIDRQADALFKAIAGFVESRLNKGQSELLDLMTVLEKRLAAIEAIARGERR